jgi:5'-methylthioadenosine phosphorylase
VANAKQIIKETIPLIEKDKICSCHEALKYAIITDRKIIPVETKKKLKIIIGKYIK